MSDARRIGLLIFIALAVPLAACSQPASDKKAAHPGRDLPEFSLKDPRGKIFTRKDILKDGAVLVVTAPILSNKSDQEDWAKHLKAAKHGNKGRLVFLEDMSPSSFKKTALSGMRKQSEAGEEPLLLIDPEGGLRKKLGVERKDTVALAYDRKGRLVHEERGTPSRGRASRIWEAMD
jgi:hypothetical protein